MSDRLIRYTLDGIKLTHDISFGVTDGDGFDVYVNRTKLDKSLDYDVIGSVDELRGGDGKITLKTAHAASDVLLILSDTLARRVTNFAKAARFEEEEIDNEFDNLLRLLEDAALNLQSTPYFDPADIGLVDGKLPPIIAEGILRVNADGNGFELIKLDEIDELQDLIKLASDEADRSKDEADKSKIEADRSEVEAGKSKLSADKAQVIAESIEAGAGDYKGLWPDADGSANKGDIYQTQVNDNPTGRYFVALKDTSVNPNNDGVNWREVVSTATLPNYTYIVCKASGGNSAVENMLAGIPVSAKVGDTCSTGGTFWRRVSVSNPVEIGDFTLLTEVLLDDFGAVGGGTASDAVAIELALDSIPSGSIVKGRPGANYMIEPRDSRLGIGVAITKNVTFKDVSFLRAPDNNLEDWLSLFVYDGDLDYIEFDGVSIDGNSRNTNNTPETFQYEHAASFRAHTGASLKKLSIYNVDLYDAVADHFYFNAVIDDVFIDNVKEHTRNATRAALQFSAIPIRSTQSNINTISYEWESVAYRDEKTRHTISNLISDRVDIISNEAVWDKTFINLENVQSGLSYLRVADFSVSNCRFEKIVDFRYCNIRASNSVFTSVNDSSIGLLSNLNENHLRFDECEFISNGSSDYVINVNAGGDDMDSLKFHDCKFSKPIALRRITNIELFDLEISDPNGIGHAISLWDESPSFPMLAKVKDVATDSTNILKITGLPDVTLDGSYYERSLGIPASSAAYPAPIKSSATVFVDSDPTGRIRGFHGASAISMTDPVQRWIYSSVAQQGFDNHWVKLTTP